MRFVGRGLTHGPWLEHASEQVFPLPPLISAVARSARVGSWCTVPVWQCQHALHNPYPPSSGTGHWTNQWRQGPGTRTSQGLCVTDRAFCHTVYYSFIEYSIIHLFWGYSLRWDLKYSFRPRKKWLIKTWLSLDSKLDVTPPWFTRCKVFLVCQLKTGWIQLTLGDIHVHEKRVMEMFQGWAAGATDREMNLQM